MLVSSDDQVKAYIKKIMSQLNKWMIGGKISKLVVVITSKETGEHIERWQFDVQLMGKSSKTRPSKKATDKENTAPEYVVRCRLRWKTADGVVEKRRQKKLHQRRPRRRSKRRSRPSSVKSPRPLHFFLYWMETAPSMYWSTPTPTRTFRLNGETAMPKRSRMAKRSSSAVSVRRIIRLIPWSVTG